MSFSEPDNYLTGQSDSGSARAFSMSARFYDDDETGNRVARWTRAENLKYLRSTFQPGDLVLEIGCGTGTEAISLARRGVRVVATDVAPGMIEQVREKIAEIGDSELGGRITPLVLSAARLRELTRPYGRGSFDGAYSSFGPLNCEPDLAGVSKALGELVRPGGQVVISLLGRFCLWETGWYLLHGEPGKAFRRWGGRAEATVRGGWRDERIPVSYWTVGEVEQAFGTDFSPLRRNALPWILPPQYLSGIFDGRRRLFRLLAAIEMRTADKRPGNTIGDHIRFTFVRKK